MTETVPVLIPAEEASEPESAAHDDDAGPGPLDVRARTLMLGLIYPAFLGAFLVVGGQDWSSLQEMGVLGWWLVLLFYFSTQYMETSVTYGTSYRWLPSFGLDALEVAAFVGAFTLLRNFDTALSPSAHHGDLQRFFALLAAVFAMPLVYRKVHEFSYKKSGIVDLLTIVSVSVLLYGVVVATSYRLGLPAWTSLRDVLAATQIGLWVVLGLYLLMIAARAHHESHPKVWGFCTHERWESKPMRILGGAIVPVALLVWVTVA